MKKNLILILLTLFTAAGFGQTPFGVFNSANEKQVATKQISANSLWLGSKLVYNVDDQAPLDDNFLLTGKILYTPIAAEKYAIPVVVTASTGGDILNPESGFNVGVFPYYKLMSSASTTLLIHGGVAYKSLQQETAEALNQIRALIGLELAVFPKAGGLPVTVSATPVYTNTSGVLGSNTHMEVTAVIPVAKSLGALIDWQSGSIGSGFRIGIIVNTAIVK